jgi:hypothetical protein
MHTIKTYQLKHTKRSGENLGNIRTPVKRQILNVLLEQSGANLGNIRTPVRRQVPNVPIVLN